MKRPIVRMVAVTAALFLALTGCTKSTPHHVSASASAAAKAQARQGEAIIQGCLARDKTLPSVESCVAPKGTGLRLKACLLRAVTVDNPLTKAGRHAFEYTAAPACLKASR